MKKIKTFLALILIGIIFGLGYFIWDNFYQRQVLKKIISRLEADSRIAEVLVTKVTKDSISNKYFTTIKFLEYTVSGIPLSPRYFTFSGNIIQFQSLVVRFNDEFIEKAVKGKDKSICLFMKVFMLDGKNTQEYPITEINKVPEGYKIEGANYRLQGLELDFWQKFWQYSLNNNLKQFLGIKNAQIEAPGIKFIPGMVYTIKIEHDGGMRIDASPVPEILKGEKLVT